MKQIQELMAQFGKQITGDPSFDGSNVAYSQLSTDDQIRIVNAVNAYIRANPKDFNETQVALANKQTGIALTSQMVSPTR